MPQYFFKYPKILVNKQLLTDIVTRIKVSDMYLDNDDLYYIYEYKDSDSPEIIAHKYYKNPELHWIILVTNNIFDPNFDLPMSYDVFKRYIEDKYKNEKAVSILSIENGGTDYIDGYYTNIPLIIKNENDLDTIGTGIKVNLTIGANTVTNITVYRGGSNYDQNTIFTVANSESFSANGSGFECSVYSYMTGIEYAQSTIHPEFGYQKEIRIIESKKVELDRSNSQVMVISEPYDILSKSYYYLDEESYYSLYEGTDPHPGEIVQLKDGSEIVYDSIRSPLITIWEHEENLNESKRNIKILKQEYYPYVVEQFINIISKTYG